MGFNGLEELFMSLCLLQYKIRYLLEYYLKLKSCRFWLHVIDFLVAESFWNFVQSTAVMLPCSVQNFKTIQ